MVCNCATVQAFMQDFPQFNWQQTEIIMENVFSIKYSFCICVFFVYLQLSLRAAKLFLQGRQNNYVMT